MKKCFTCGYEFEESWENKRQEIIKGDRPFINIKGSFHVENDYYGGEFRVRLIACPVCNTVKLEDN